MKLKTTMPRVIIRLSKYDESRNRKNAIMRMDQAYTYLTLVTPQQSSYLLYTI
jgi:hypothetical protein